MNVETRSVRDLRAELRSLREREPRLRARDAAKRLETTEAQLLAANVPETAVRLDARFMEILKRLEAAGKITGITRNEYIVIEREGVYRNVEGEGIHAQVVDEGMDLRIFLNRWHVGYALREETERGTRRSLQFFDAHGTAIHKTFHFESDAARDVFDGIARDHAASDQRRQESVTPAAVKPAETPDSEVDLEAFRAGWASLKDTHEFFFLLRKFGVTRAQALRLGGDQFVRKSDPGMLKTLLEAIAASGQEVMCFVGNHGCIQIHTGPIKNVKPMHGWLNVLDKGFNLHIDETGIASAWVVRKPTRDGLVTSFELLDRNGENVLLVFGKRKPGMQEAEGWRAIVEAF